MGRMATVSASGDDSLVACGLRFPTGTRVVGFLEAGGLNGYRVDAHGAGDAGERQRDPGDAVPAGLGANRYGNRAVAAPAAGEESADSFRRGEDWTLEGLREQVTQVVLHYDGCGTSRRCFRVMHDERGLSCHLLVDVDGTVYQTLDLKERAWHAGGAANDRSVGIEIANVGAFPVNSPEAKEAWARHYRPVSAFGHQDGREAVVVRGEEVGRSEDVYVGLPRAGARTGPCQAEGELVMQDFTREQYRSLAKVVSALHDIFPKVKLVVPDCDGGAGVMTKMMGEEEKAKYEGILGHLHLQSYKIDPGPAMQWRSLLDDVARLRTPKEKSSFHEAGLLDSDLVGVASARRRAGTIPFRVTTSMWGGLTAEVLLISSRKYPWRWSLPAGGVEEGESPGDCAVRESLEEAGVGGRLGNLVGQYVRTREGSRRTRTAVYELAVGTVYPSWKEMDGRERRWVEWRAAVEDLAWKPELEAALAKWGGMAQASLDALSRKL